MEIMKISKLLQLKTIGHNNYATTCTLKSTYNLSMKTTVTYLNMCNKFD